MIFGQVIWHSRHCFSYTTSCKGVTPLKQTLWSGSGNRNHKLCLQSLRINDISQYCGIVCLHKYMCAQLAILWFSYFANSNDTQACFLWTALWDCFMFWPESVRNAYLPVGPFSVAYTVCCPVKKRFPLKKPWIDFPKAVWIMAFVYISVCVSVAC